jgi:Right handed beta helix region
MKTVPTIDQRLPQGPNMRRIAVTFALSVGAFALSLPAHATGVTRTFVSSTGVDTNPCTVTQPCATFAAAYALVAPNGIVAALDPGKYGPLTINTPVTIDGNGWAAITAPGSGGAGISISAGTSAAIILRGLTIDGGSSGSNGIEFSAGGSLTIAGCAVRNVSDSGLFVFNNNGNALMTLTVEDSYFINTGTGAYLIGASSGALTASFVRTEFTGNGEDGLQVDGTNGTGAISVTVTDSVAANNFDSGFEIDSASAHSVVNLSLTQVQTAGNGTGVTASGNNATLWLAHSTVANNAAGYSAQSNGVINSYGDNYFVNNGTSTGSLTAANPGKQ